MVCIEAQPQPGHFAGDSLRGRLHRGSHRRAQRGAGIEAAALDRVDDDPARRQMQSARQGDRLGKTEGVAGSARPAGRQRVQGQVEAMDPPGLPQGRNRIDAHDGLAVAPVIQQRQRIGAVNLHRDVLGQKPMQCLGHQATDRIVAAIRMTECADRHPGRPGSQAR